MFLVSMMITDFSFCSGVASLGSDCMLSWSLWMFRWFWIVNHQNCCSNNSSFMAGRVKHLCQEWSITIWLVLIKFWQVPWNVRLREWPIIGNGEAICVQVNTTWLIVTMCCHGYKISDLSIFTSIPGSAYLRMEADWASVFQGTLMISQCLGDWFMLVSSCNLHIRANFIKPRAGTLPIRLWATWRAIGKNKEKFLASSTLSYLKSYGEE